MNVVLRDLVATDAGWLDAWLPQVAEAVGYEHQNAADLLQTAKKSRCHAQIIVCDDVDVGLAVYRVVAPRKGAAIIELVATPREHARKGAGMTAAALVERELRDAGVNTVYAPAPAVHGIAMYFWIRLGYAPILRADWPCEREGVAWLRRSIAGT